MTLYVNTFVTCVFLVTDNIQCLISNINEFGIVNIRASQLNDSQLTKLIITIT